RDLRPDVPQDVAAILLRMMAKRPEDRFADYDELIAALDAVPLVSEVGVPAIPLAPLDEDEYANRRGVVVEDRLRWSQTTGRAWREGSEESRLARESHEGLTSDPCEESQLTPSRSGVAPPLAPLPRTNRNGPPGTAVDGPPLDEVFTVSPS